VKDETAHATIVIPAFNEGEAIGSTLEQLVSLGLTDRYEVIVVNDGSTDNTREVVEGFTAIRLVNHTVNKGYGAALKTGIRRARTNKIVIMDSDGQHSPDKVEEVVRLLDEYPMVIGERTAESHQVANRMLGKQIIRWIGEFLLSQKLPDFNSGFRGFQRDAITVMLNIMPNGFSMSTTSTMAFLKLGYDIGTVPIHVTPRVGRPSNVKFLRDGSKTILLICRIVMLFNPLKIFFPSSVITTMLGAVWAIYGFVAAGRIPNSAVIIVTLGLLLGFIGLLADQIAMLNLSRQVIHHGDN